MIAIDLIRHVLDFLANNKDAFIAAGVLVGAMTAVGTSWWASRATHRSMVSQMRERWIESLRAEIAELNGLGLLIARAKHDPSFNGFEFLHKTQIIGNKVILRLNPDNASHAELEAAVRRSLLAKDDQERDLAGEALVHTARKVIQQTWSKAERGAL